MSRWWTHARCLGADPTLFDEKPMRRNQKLSAHFIFTAAAFCGPCPVREACAAEADENRDVGLRAGVYRTSASDGTKYRGIPLIPLEDDEDLRKDLIEGEFPHYGDGVA